MRRRRFVCWVSSSCSSARESVDSGLNLIKIKFHNYSSPRERERERETEKCMTFFSCFIITGSKVPVLQIERSLVINYVSWSLLRGKGIGRWTPHSSLNFSDSVIFFQMMFLLLWRALQYCAFLFEEEKKKGCVFLRVFVGTWQPIWSFHSPRPTTVESKP